MKDEYDFSKAVRGPISAPQPGTTRITTALDDEVLDWFRDKVDRAGGGNYQALMNDVLREHISGSALENMLRRVLREELSAARG